MKKYSFVHYCVCAIVLAGCASVKVPGTYRSRDGLYSLALNSDSTFLFNYKFQFDTKRSQGFFKMLDSKTIKLRSSIVDKKMPIEVIEKPNSDSWNNLLRIGFNLPGNETQYYKCLLLINGVPFVTAHCDSLSLVKIDKTLNDFSIGISADERLPGRFLDTLYTKTFVTKTNNRNDLFVNVQVQDSLFNYRVFDDAIMRISNKRLLLFDGKERLILFKQN